MFHSYCPSCVRFSRSLNAPALFAFMLRLTVYKSVPASSHRFFCYCLFFIYFLLIFALLTVFQACVLPFPIVHRAPKSKSLCKMRTQIMVENPPRSRRRPDNWTSAAHPQNHAGKGLPVVKESTRDGAQLPGFALDPPQHRTVRSSALAHRKQLIAYLFQFLKSPQTDLSCAGGIFTQNTFCFTRGAIKGFEPFLWSN